MKPMSYSSLRSSLAKSMDYVCENHDPIVITRSKSEPVVLISLEDYESFTETAYLTRSPANAARLEAAIKSLNQGNGRVQELDI